MRIKSSLLCVAGPPLLIGGLLGISACNINVPNSAAVCSGGKCATVSAIPNQPSGHPTHHQTPAPPVSTPVSTPTTAAPDNTITVTATPTPTVTPTFVVANCTLYLTHAELYQLANSASARNALAICMEIPGANQIPQGPAAVAFENQLALYALAALQSGDYRPFPGKLESLHQRYVPAS